MTLLAWTFSEVSRFGHQSAHQVVRATATATVGLHRLWAQLYRWRRQWDTALKSRVLVAVELLAIVAWALWMTRPYLDLNPQVVAIGDEYAQDVMPHDFWRRAQECGMCALWFGGTRGGSPALVEPFNSSVLHPLVVITSLGWGVENGAKLALVGAFIMAGVAQWWLGHALGLGRMARLWSAGMAIVGGHLAARMQLGAYTVLFATAGCALVLPPLVALVRDGRRRTAVLLGVVLALAAFSGRWYMQTGLAFTLLAVLLLLPWNREELAVLGLRFALAAGLALLLSAPFLIPFIHFMPELAKDADPTFSSAQPLGYIPLNLVISDMKFYNSDVLNKLPFPSHYAAFVGWIPVLLAVWGLGAARDSTERRLIAFLAASVLLALWVASAVPLVWLARALPDSMLARLVGGVRYTAFIAGLAITPLLALAGFGVDRLLRTGWPRFQLSIGEGTAASNVAFNLRWLLVVPLLIALHDAQVFSSQFIGTRQLGADFPAILDALQTSDAQWVAVPFGEHRYTQQAVAAGLKLTNDFRTWHWNEHPDPQPVLEAHRAADLPGMTPIGSGVGAYLYVAPPGREYAVVESEHDRIVCTAKARGGDIDVSCDAPEPGLLTVKENNWSGWQVLVDEQRTGLHPDRWLAVNVPAGSHHIAFRYRPWDALVGGALALVGMALAGYIWLKPDGPASSIL